MSVNVSPAAEYFRDDPNLRTGVVERAGVSAAGHTGPSAILVIMKSRPAAVLIAVAVLGATPAIAHADLSGDPDGASQYWGRQHYDDCALMAVADVVGELTGNKPPEDEVIALAISTANGRNSGTIYTLPADAGDGGVSRRDQLPVIRDLPVLLAHYGVASVYTNDSVAAEGGFPTGITGLEAALGAGKKVIASLNGETIWDIPGDRTIHDHDVVVTGVDTGTGTVHLNDSAAEGPNSQVSVETFESAWMTSNHSMVVAG